MCSLFRINPFSQEFLEMAPSHFWWLFHAFQKYEQDMLNMDKSKMDYLIGWLNPEMVKYLKEPTTIEATDDGDDFDGDVPQAAEAADDISMGDNVNKTEKK